MSDLKNGGEKKRKLDMFFVGLVARVMFIEAKFVFFCLVFADRLYLPSSLVLSDCGITTAGDGSTIAAFCGHVVELDISKNQLNDWVEVR